MRSVFLGFLLLLSAAVASADKPRLSPLSGEERALATERVEQRLAARAQGRNPEKAPEFLRVERRQRSKAEHAAGRERGADVYLYDYDKNVTLHSVVSLTTGEVESEEELPGVQMPLTEREIAEATKIALRHPSVGQRIQQYFRERTGAVLEDLGQLHAKAMVFSSESMPDTVNAKSRVCGVDRCAQLLLYTTEFVTVEVIPIVNLSTGELVQVLDF